MYSQRPPFQGGEAPFFVGERGISRSSNRHFRREQDRAAEVNCVWNEITAASAKAGARFEIRPEQQRDLAHSLQRVELRGELDWGAHGNGEAADFFLLDV